MDLLQKLQGYYRNKGIAAEHFKCPHLEDCRGRSKKFVEATEAFVGSCYQQHKTPRLLFISAAPGENRDWSPKDRTVYGRRDRVSESNFLIKSRKSHWFRTCELAYEIFSCLNVDLINPNRVQHYFASTDVVKCGQNNKHGAQPDARLFRNCTQFMVGEIEILNPDILITQGCEAYKSIKDNFEKFNRRDYLNKGRKKLSLFNEVKVLKINNRPVLWISTHHPNSHGNAFPKQMKKWPEYAEIVKDFRANI